jgi:hypothetical protein
MGVQGTELGVFGTFQGIEKEIAIRDDQEIGLDALGRRRPREDLGAVKLNSQCMDENPKELGVYDSDMLKRQ